MEKLQSKKGTESLLGSSGAFLSWREAPVDVSAGAKPQTQLPSSKRCSKQLVSEIKQISRCLHAHWLGRMKAQGPDVGLEIIPTSKSENKHQELPLPVEPMQTYPHTCQEHLHTAGTTQILQQGLLCLTCWSRAKKSNTWFNFHTCMKTT